MYFCEFPRTVSRTVPACFKCRLVLFCATEFEVTTCGSSELQRYPRAKWDGPQNHIVQTSCPSQQPVSPWGVTLKSSNPWPRARGNAFKMLFRSSLRVFRASVVRLVGLLAGSPREAFGIPIAPWDGEDACNLEVYKSPHFGDLLEKAIMSIG